MHNLLPKSLGFEACRGPLHLAVWWLHGCLLRVLIICLQFMCPATWPRGYTFGRLFSSHDYAVWRPPGLSPPCHVPNNLLWARPNIWRQTLILIEIFLSNIPNHFYQRSSTVTSGVLLGILRCRQYTHLFFRQHCTDPFLNPLSSWEFTLLAWSMGPFTQIHWKQCSTTSWPAVAPLLLPENS